MADLIHTISTHLPFVLLVMFRLGGLMAFAPVLGSSVIPMQVKAMLCFLIALAVYPLLASEHFVGLSLELSLFGLVPLIAAELLIGVIVGYAASLPLVAIQTGGLVMGQQMGLGFAQFYNPTIDDQSDVFGQLMFFMILIGFLMIGGHEAMVLAILHSFEHIPPGGFAPDTGLIELLTGLLLAAFELALRVGAPLLALVFLESIAMGFVSKSVPQLNILSLGFPVRILMGIGTVFIGLEIINEVVMEGVDEGLRTIFAWIEHG